MIKTAALLLSILVTLVACGNRTSDSGHGPSTSGTAPPSKNNGFLTKDNEIIENLRVHLGLEPVEKGGAGRCLFHSLREQISKTELVHVSAAWDAKIKNQLNNYDTLLPDEKADLLREIAIFEEKLFLEPSVAKKFADLSNDEQVWALEMAKDWYQEFHGVNNARTWFLANKDTAAGREIMWQFVINNRNAYWAKTGCATNWAGSAEAIVFSRILQRPLRMYGRDLATSTKGAKLDAGVVMPYLDYNFAYTGDPLLILQTSGGGHYQMLKKVTK